jgi:hypothetical protein
LVWAGVLVTAELPSPVVVGIIEATTLVRSPGFRRTWIGYATSHLPVSVASSVVSVFCSIILSIIVATVRVSNTL